MKTIMVRCPCRRPHKQKEIPIEDCDKVLTFVAPGSQGYIKCKSCKKLIHYDCTNPVAVVTAYPSSFKLDTHEEGLVVINDYIE